MREEIPLRISKGSTTATDLIQELPHPITTTCIHLLKDKKSNNKHQTRMQTRESLMRATNRDLILRIRRKLVLVATATRLLNPQMKKKTTIWEGNILPQLKTPNFKISNIIPNHHNPDQLSIRSMANRSSSMMRIRSKASSKGHITLKMEALVKAMAITWFIKKKEKSTRHLTDSSTMETRWPRPLLQLLHTINLLPTLKIMLLHKRNLFSLFLSSQRLEHQLLVTLRIDS